MTVRFILKIVSVATGLFCAAVLSMFGMQGINLVFVFFIATLLVMGFLDRNYTRGWGL